MRCVFVAVILVLGSFYGCAERATFRLDGATSDSPVVTDTPVAPDAVDDVPASCPSPNATCGAACVNLQTNAANCGACGRSCAGGEACVAATCVSQTGDACATDMECGVGGFCARNAEFPQGYCTRVCTNIPGECGVRGVCLTLQGTGYCFRRCTSGSDCRTEYQCVSPPSGGPTVCYVRCEASPGVCEQASCNPVDHFCRNGQCTSPDICSAGSFCSAGTCRCTSATNCGVGRRCDSTTGQCSCVSDLGCGLERCDVATGRCLAR